MCDNYFFLQGGSKKREIAVKSCLEPLRNSLQRRETHFCSWMLVE